MKPKTIALVGAFSFAVALSASGQVFDDFNVDEGHFSSSPTLSGTSVGEAASSTADRVTTDEPFEGFGHQRLVLNSDGGTTLLRIRHLSGGAAPSGNVSFTTSAGTDGWIGYYVKTTVSGMQTQINLDGPANSSAQMRGSPSVSLISDGAWHLYEWDLDAAIWGTVPGIVSQTTAALPDLTYTIDSIYFRDVSGTPSPSGTYYLDFVARNAAGSVADLVPVPEPSAYAMGFGLLLAGFAGYRRLKLK